jgi:hypothetical protein
MSRLKDSTAWFLLVFCVLSAGEFVRFGYTHRLSRLADAVLLLALAVCWGWWFRGFFERGKITRLNLGKQSESNDV